MSEGILARPIAPGHHIAYGPGASQWGDLRLPARPGPHPVVVLIHGGYWRVRHDLTYLGHAAVALTEAGFATWNVEYRRLGEPGGGWPGTLLDVAAGVDFLRTLAPAHDLDLGRVVTLGHSAGGQLALWLAGRPRIQLDSPLASVDPLRLSGVTALAPVCDLARAWELGLSSGAVASLLGGSPDEHPDRYAAASPIELLPLGVPQVLIHGTEDEDVPLELSERHAAVARASNDRARLIAFPNTGHFEIIDPATSQWQTILQAICAQVEEV